MPGHYGTSITRDSLQQRESDRVNALGRRRLAEQAEFDRINQAKQGVMKAIAGTQNPNEKLMIMDEAVRGGIMTSEEAVAMMDTPLDRTGATQQGISEQDLGYGTVQPRQLAQF